MLLYAAFVCLHVHGKIQSCEYTGDWGVGAFTSLERCQWEMVSDWENVRVTLKSMWRYLDAGGRIKMGAGPGGGTLYMQCLSRRVDAWKAP